MNELFAFQKEGVDWLKGHKFCLLADEMGLGKSAQTIRAFDELGLKRVLVICPAVARTNWSREIKAWTGSKRNAEAVIRNRIPVFDEKESTVVCSFEFASKNFKNLCSSTWDLLIIDECHYAKSVEAKRSQNVFGSNGIVHSAQRVWSLSGTPAPNHAGELWILLFTFGVTKLNYWAFVDRYCDTIDTGYGRKVVGTRVAMIPELKTLLSRVMLRRKKSEVLDLPPLFYSTVVVEPGAVELDSEPSLVQYMGPEGNKNLQTILRTERDTLEKKLVSPDEMKLFEGIAGSISTLRRYTGLQKVEPVAELVSQELEHKLYHKIVIFGIHRAVLSQLQNKLKRFGAVVVNGDTRDKQAAVDAFQNDPTTQIFIGNIQAAGTNLTLTAAHNVLFVEEDFVPGNNAQAAMRCHRIGQQNSVSIRFASLNNWLSERMTQIISRKTRELTEIFNS